MIYLGQPQKNNKSRKDESNKRSWSKFFNHFLILSFFCVTFFFSFFNNFIILDVLLLIFSVLSFLYWAQLWQKSKPRFSLFEARISCLRLFFSFFFRQHGFLLLAKASPRGGASTTFLSVQAETSTGGSLCRTSRAFFFARSLFYRLNLIH